MTTRNPFGSAEGAPPEDFSPRVLIVDDSAPLRAVIAETLEEGGCSIVGRAMDGSVALKMVMEEDPDVITLDLEMPRMDGFTFLRILQKTRNTPVIVITSDARPEAALMALELGARDFVVKPARPGDIRGLKAQLLARVRTLAALRGRMPPTWAPPADVAIPRDIALLCIGCSTGGPRALRDILTRVKEPPRVPVLIAQHMPPRFTQAFAERLQRASGLDVREGIDGEVLTPGLIRVAPGGRNLVVERQGTKLIARVQEPTTEDRWVPSTDALLRTAAAAVGHRMLAVVLTGMGRDGARGAEAVAAAGAPLWAESPLTAAVDGMPLAAAKAHGNADRVPLDELAELVARTLAPS